MEKIIIKEIGEELKTKSGDSFWGVVLGDGRKATVWDGQIAADIKCNMNWPTMAEVKQQGAYLNIRAFEGERKATTDQIADTKPEVQSPLDAGEYNGAKVDPASTLEFEAKSSVKLKKNSKGMGWELKVVKGEEGLIMGLMEAAVVAHKALEKEFVEVIKVK